MKPDFKTFVVPEKQMVVAIGTYRGQSVRAISKCHPRDEFDEHKGRVIAEFRLEQKLVEKRKKTAVQRMANIDRQVEYLQRQIARLEADKQRTRENLVALKSIATDIEDQLTRIAD